MDQSRWAARRAAFRKLHTEGCFLLPNPWDAGTARALAGMGFQALATTSAGYAWSCGQGDHGLGLEAVLEHCRALAAATELPVNADFESGYARHLDELGENVRRCAATGVAGLSIEDSTGDGAQPLYALSEAVARVSTVRAALDSYIAASGEDVMLVARAECFLTGHPDPLPEAVRRLQAYAAAGADCLYAPGALTLAQITALVGAVAPKPLNVLVGRSAPYTLAELAALGVRRVSVGGALAGAAWGGFLRAARELAAGRFDGFAGNAPRAELNGLFHSGA